MDFVAVLFTLILRGMTVLNVGIYMSRWSRV